MSYAEDVRGIVQYLKTFCEAPDASGQAFPQAVDEATEAVVNVAFETIARRNYPDLSDASLTYNLMRAAFLLGVQSVPDTVLVVMEGGEPGPMPPVRPIRRPRGGKGRRRHG